MTLPIFHIVAALNNLHTFSEHLSECCPPCLGSVLNHLYSGNDSNMLCSLDRKGREDGGEVREEAYHTVKLQLQFP